MDWLEEGAGERSLMRARMKIDSLLPGTQQAKRLRRYQMLAQWRLRRGISMLSQGRVIVTDRLHAHILSLLLDIPQVVLDNMYGKVSAFAAQWRSDEHTSELQSLMRTSYAVFCLKKTITIQQYTN